MGKTTIEWTKLSFGNRLITTGGYAIVYCPNHPSAKSNGYVYEHRLIMENKIQRFLYKNEAVHHINGISDDNRAENLILMTATEHGKLHYAERPDELKQKAIKGLNDAAKARKIIRQFKQKSCACGCGKIITTPDRKGRENKYARGHNGRWLNG
jgi:hypothetical protein